MKSTSAVRSASPIISQIVRFVITFLRRNNCHMITLFLRNNQAVCTLFRRNNLERRTFSWRLLTQSHTFSVKFLLNSVKIPTREPPSRWVVPLRLCPLRMARLARECFVGPTDRTDTPCIRLLRSFPFRPMLGYGYESAAPDGHGLSI